MDLKSTIGRRDRLVRGVLAVGLGLVAVLALRKGKRKTGLLVGLGAVGLGVSARTGGVADGLDVDQPSESHETTVEAEETTTARATGSAATRTAGVTAPEPTGGSTATGSSSLICADCGQPIEVGQRRGPNEDDEIVHEECP